MTRFSCIFKQRRNNTELRSPACCWRNQQKHLELSTLRNILQSCQAFCTCTTENVVNNPRKQRTTAKTSFPVDMKPFRWCYKVNKKTLSSHRSSFASTPQWELCMWNVLWGRLAEQRTRKTRRITKRMWSTVWGRFITWELLNISKLSLQPDENYMFFLKSTNSFSKLQINLTLFF